MYKYLEGIIINILQKDKIDMTLKIEPSGAYLLQEYYQSG